MPVPITDMAPQRLCGMHVWLQDAESHRGGGGWHHGDTLSAVLGWGLMGPPQQSPKNTLTAGQPPHPPPPGAPVVAVLLGTTAPGAARGSRDGGTGDAQGAGGGSTGDGGRAPAPLAAPPPPTSSGAASGSRLLRTAKEHSGPNYSKSEADLELARKQKKKKTNKTQDVNGRQVGRQRPGALSFRHAVIPHPLGYTPPRTGSGGGTPKLGWAEGRG